MKYFETVPLQKFKGLLEEIKLLERTGEVSWLQPTNPLSSSQICLNAAPGYTDDVGFGSGFFADKGKSDFFIRHTPEGDVRIPMKPSSVYDWELCDVFVGTIFDDVFAEMKKKFNIGRVRLLQSTPRTCMNWHIDPIPRIHYPIQTEEGCLMIIEDEVFHLPLEQWTFAHTDKGYHTALNASNENRIHLVADILP
jgi:hypothetical protein